jgi:hypothetical protein
VTHETLLQIVFVLVEMRFITFGANAREVMSPAKKHRTSVWLGCCTPNLNPNNNLNPPKKSAP